MWQNSTLSITQDSTVKKTLANGIGTPVSEISSSYSMDFVQHSVEPKSTSKNQPFSNINLPNNFNAGKLQISSCLGIIISF